SHRHTTPPSLIGKAAGGLGWAAVLLAAGVVSPLLVGWLANPVMPFFHERFVLMGAAILLVAVAGGLDWLWRQPAAGLMATVLVLVVNGVALDHWYFDPQYIKSDYGQALRTLYAQAQSGDLILLNNTEQLPLFTFYHLEGPGRPGWAPLTNDDVFTAESTDRRLSRVTAGHDRVWLINYGAKDVYDPESHAEQWLAAHGFRALFWSRRGFEVAMYLLAGRLPQTPTIAAPVQFADGVRLLGADLQPQPAQPGASLRVTLFWQATQMPKARYTVFCHLVDGQGRLVAQFDGEPVGGTAPTTGWQANATVIDRRAVELPPDLAAGTYTLRVGLYPWPDLTRLAVQNTALPVVDNAVAVTAVEVAR
ncbi:MAG: hypothetical protein KIT87_27635, partial [Anaerolineae bacterium]|nr:hypothetical protein [Anaerolineae bacterium]